jgi:hypothetical protein
MPLIYDQNGRPIDTSDAARAERLRNQAAQPVLGPRGVIGAPPPTQTQLPLPVVTPGVVPNPPAPAPAPLNEEQAFAQGQQLTRPAGMSEDVPTVAGQTYPLQPLVLNPMLQPGEVGPPAPIPVTVTGARDASALAGVNQGIAQALAASKPVPSQLQPAQRGVYNQQNTDISALPKPVGGGLNFGFGANGAPSARDVLNQYALQDAQASLRQQERFRVASRAPIESTLAEAVRTKDAIGIRGARAQLAAFDAGHQSTTAEQGLTLRAGLVAESAKGVAQTSAEATIAAAQERNLAAIEAANLTGQYGVTAAQAKAAGALGAAQVDAASGTNRLANANAALAETRLGAVDAGVASGDLTLADIIAGTRTGQEVAPRQVIDPTTGIPYTEEEIRIAQERRLARAKKQQQ